MEEKKMREIRIKEINEVKNEQAKKKEEPTGWKNIKPEGNITQADVDAFFKKMFG